MKSRGLPLINPMNLQVPASAGGGGIVLPYQKRRPQIGENVFIAPTASIIGSVWLGDNVSIWFGAVLRGDSEDIRVGHGSNVQDLCDIHADPGDPCIIGMNVSVGHKAILHGCTVEDECTIGMGAIILNKAVIGKGSIVGAGALVTQRVVIPPNSLVLGSPARIKRAVTEEEMKKQSANTEMYAAKALHYLEIATVPDDVDCDLSSD